MMVAQALGLYKSKDIHRICDANHLNAQKLRNTERSSIRHHSLQPSIRVSMNILAWNIPRLSGMSLPKNCLNPSLQLVTVQLLVKLTRSPITIS